jgi:hypothetical protein
MVAVPRAVIALGTDPGAAMVTLGENVARADDDEEDEAAEQGRNQTRLGLRESRYAADRREEDARG